MANVPSNEGLSIHPHYEPHYHESEINELDNCTYLYDYANSEPVDILSLYLDGPLTLFFAVLALLGGRLAVKFLGRARLNKDLTSGC